MLTRLRPPQIPLRVRLTIWYLVFLALILLLFGWFVHTQVHRSLLDQVDGALQLAATQALVNVNVDQGVLSFQNTENSADLTRRVRDDTAILLLAPDGAILDNLGNADEAPAVAPVAGFRTFSSGDDTLRIYAESVNLPGEPTEGWLQVSQSLESVEQTLLLLRLQILWGLPLALLTAGFGGVFLSSRALQPIDQITRTAQAIHASDLTRRIGHPGPMDEVGRLAATFDNMLDRLQAAFDRERRFTGDAAHELRTPLTALKGRIGVTLSQPRQPAEYSETLQEIEEQVDRLIRLSNDLLLMARLDQGQLQQQHEAIALADLLGAVLDQVRPLAETKSITIGGDVSAGLTVRGNLDLLIRLFLNLLDNAIKYTPPGGRVAVQADQSGPQVTVTIRDTGPGIPGEHVPHLFERFYRVAFDRSRDDGQGGAGLGLAIAYEIARAHAGNLTVQSKVGQGTTFLVYLPTFADDKAVLPHDLQDS